MKVSAAQVLIKKLQHALDTIKVLKGIIPICASCKKIRDDKGNWNKLETYEALAEPFFLQGAIQQIV